MKTSRIFLFTLLFVFSVNAQWMDNGNTMTTNDNVIVQSTNSGATLDIFSTETSNHWLLRGNTNSSNWSGLWGTSDNVQLLLRDVSGNVDVALTPNGDSYINGGNIGIGTTSPDAKLEINDGDIHVNKSTSAGAYRIRFRDHSASFGYDVDGSLIGRDGAFISTQDASKPFFIATAGVINYAFRTNGNMGIGIENPSAKLQVMGGIGINTGVAGNLSSGSALAIGDGDTGLKQQGDGHLAIYTNNQQRFLVNNAGNIGIGTISPDDKLTVKGRIHAEEVKVDLSVPGPDYVFKEGYDLKSLEEVQHYIKEKGHLPNIPSALEMEENGVELGIMNMKLLEKIEELTLYIIDIQEQVEQLKKDNSVLRKDLSE